MNPWDEVLGCIRSTLEREDFQRWFAPTTFAGDAGNCVTVWVPSEVIRRHLTNHFQDTIDRAFKAIGRSGTEIRFVVTGYEDEEEEDA